MAAPKRAKAYQITIYLRGHLSKPQVGEFKISADSEEKALQEGWLNLFLKAEPERSRKAT
jgi:hypothetical protein